MVGVFGLVDEDRNDDVAEWLVVLIVRFADHAAHGLNDVDHRASRIDESHAIECLHIDAFTQTATVGQEAPSVVW